MGKFALRETKWYGYRPDIPDKRDFYMAAPPSARSLPAAMSLLPACPPVFCQGDIGSCSAHAIATNHMIAQWRQHGRFTMVPSRLFQYYNSRLLGGNEDYDSGAQIRDAIKAVVKWGICHEDQWPYDEGRVLDKPGFLDYWSASSHQAVKYERIRQDLDYLRGCIADGFPFIFGFTVYSGFESVEVEETGILGVPKPEEKLVGGHAVLAVGYDDAQPTPGLPGAFRIRNSWGPDWGVDGDFFMPYDYIVDPDLAADFWTIRLVEA